jgi:2-polyprenyl-3-methyl-5-hydroxy-6-metoxy-1,4-benzoquinol methylase
MPDNKREELFDDYFDSSYKHGNILTKNQLDIASQSFEREYKGVLPVDKDAVILDFGCGTGGFLYHLKKMGFKNFFGVDISRSQVEYCRKNVSDRVEAINGLDYLKSKINTYDVITAYDVLEHLPKSETLYFLELAFAALKNRGKIIVRVPNMSNPFGLDARFNDFTHEVGFTSKSLYQVLWLAGFRSVTILQDQAIDVRSFRNWVRKVLIGWLHHWLRFCYYIQDYTVPKNLNKNLVAVATKNENS